MIKEWGFWLMLGGAVIMLAAFFVLTPGVDASAAAGEFGVRLPSAVFNLGRAQQQTLVFGAGVTAALMGAVLYAAGIVEEAVMRAGGFRRTTEDRPAPTADKPSTVQPYDAEAWKQPPTRG